MHDVVSLLSVMGLTLSMTGCAKYLWRAMTGGRKDLDPEFDNVFSLVETLSFCSVPGTFLSIAVLSLCFWLRKSTGDPLQENLAVGVIGLCLGLFGLLSNA